MSIRRVSTVLVLLLLMDCGKEAPLNVALVVVYDGPTDKYIPCLVLSSEEHGTRAMTLAEGAGCRPFASLVATTDRSDFFENLEALSASAQADAGSSPAKVHFFVLDRSGAHSQKTFEIAAAVDFIAGILQFFPQMAPRIESEFIKRVRRQ